MQTRLLLLLKKKKKLLLLHFQIAAVSFLSLIFPSGAVRLSQQRPIMKGHAWKKEKKKKKKREKATSPTHQQIFERWLSYSWVVFKIPQHWAEQNGQTAGAEATDIKLKKGTLNCVEERDRAHEYKRPAQNAKGKHNQINNNKTQPENKKNGQSGFDGL